MPCWDTELSSCTEKLFLAFRQLLPLFVLERRELLIIKNVFVWATIINYHQLYSL
jgi:hypothetical protein